MKEDIAKIQDEIISFLREDNKDAKKQLSDLCADSCSEMSRLAAFWLSQKVPKTEFFILKGDGIRKGKSHDILAVSSLNKIFLLDTTIWQFFPSRKSIYLGEFADLDKAIIFLEKFYGGKWQVSEKLNNESFKEKDKWKKIIRSNLKE